METADFWFYLRMLNICTAFIAVLVLGIKHIRKDWHHIEPYKRASALSNEAYGIGYIIAAILAEQQGAEAGTYTAVMSIPIFWHLLAGLLNDDQNERHRK